MLCNVALLLSIFLDVGVGAYESEHRKRGENQDSDRRRSMKLVL